MVAKLVILLAIFVIVFSVAMLLAYRYFDNQAERKHQKDLKQMEHTERMVDIAEQEYDDV